MTELASLFLLVLLPPADATSETAQAIQTTLRSMLGEVTMAVAPDSVVTQAMWKQEGSQLHAHFVAHLVWKDRDRASVELVALGANGTSQTTRRELSFTPQDDKAERGRAVALVIAALLREFPAAAWLRPPPADEVAAGGSRAPLSIVLGGMFAFERARTGNWPMGPALLYDLSLSDSFRVRARAMALIGNLDGYREIGVGLGATWDFLRSRDGHHALGAGLELDGFHEATSSPGDHPSNDSTLNAALGPTLGGRVTIWRSLRLIGEAGLRLSLARMTLTVGDDFDRRTYTYSRWRTIFAVGLEYAL